MYACAVIFLVAFLVAFAVLVSLSIRHTVNVAKSQQRTRQAMSRTMLELHPLYQAKVEAERRYELETIKLQQAHTLDMLEHDLKRYLSMHRIPSETYLLNEVPGSLTPLPSLKPVSRDMPAIIQNNLLPARYDLIDIFWNNDITPEHVFLGKGMDGHGIFCRASQLHHGCFNAATGRGKTVLERGILTQLIHIGHHVVLCDLKFTLMTEDKLDYRPIAKRLYEQPFIRLAEGYHLPSLVRKEAQIAALLHHLAYTEINTRLNMRARGDYSFATLDVFVEELTALIKAYPKVADDIVRIVALGRELRVNVFTAAQNFLVRDINMSGGARENFITAYFLGGDMRSGSQILDMSLKELDGFLRANNIELGRGIGMLRNEFVQPEAALVSLGTASNEAIYYLLGRADGFTLPDLTTDELEPLPATITETPELVKARELWQAGHTSDRKLQAAMKIAGFEVSLYRANQLANQLKASE